MNSLSTLEVILQKQKQKKQQKKKNWEMNYPFDTKTKLNFHWLTGANWIYLTFCKK